MYCTYVCKHYIHTYISSPWGVDHVAQSRDTGPLQKMYVGRAAAYVGGEEDGQALAHGVVGLAACEVQEEEGKQHLCMCVCIYACIRTCIYTHMHVAGVGNRFESRQKFMRSIASWSLEGSINTHTHTRTHTHAHAPQALHSHHPKELNQDNISPRMHVHHIPSTNEHTETHTHVAPARHLRSAVCPRQEVWRTPQRRGHADRQTHQRGMRIA
jgi:hypothetical protein